MASLTAGMGIDVLKYANSSNILRDCEELGALPCFKQYASPSDGIDTNKLFCYVVLLYSRDSILNKKPMPELKARKLKAAKLAGFDSEDPVFKSKVFDLDDDKISELIIAFLISQNELQWTERCVLEAQIEENHRVRFKLVESDKDKEAIEALGKKFSITEHYSKYYKLLCEIDKDLFADHDDVRESLKKNRTTLESLVKSA